jgi:polyhydroxyalkanoate synthesis regulator phasin
MDMIKNFIYAGVGLATTTTEKAKETINDLVEKGKISDTEGKKIMDDFFKSTENTKEEFETKWKKLNDTLTSKFDFISSKETDEVKVLKSRIADLEEKLAKSTKKVEAKKTTTKTTVAKKPAAKKTTTKKTTAKKVAVTK